MAHFYMYLKSFQNCSRNGSSVYATKFLNCSQINWGKAIFSILQSIIFYTDLFTENCFKLWPDRNNWPFSITLYWSKHLTILLICKCHNKNKHYYWRSKLLCAKIDWAGRWDYYEVTILEERRTICIGFHFQMMHS